MKTVQDAELRATLCVEAANTLKEKYTLDIAIAGQAQAYTNTKHRKDNQLRYILIPKRDPHWAPEKHREQVARLLDQDLAACSSR